MKQSTISSLSNSITDDEREVAEILLNLPNLIKQSKSYFKFDLSVWGNKKRRSAIDIIPSPRQQRWPEKDKNAAGEGSPATPLSFSPSESDDKTQKFFKIVTQKKTKEELSEKVNELVQAKESLTKELERVKDYHNNLEVYNKLLKAKQQELQFLRQSEPNVDQSKKTLNFSIKLSQNKPSYPFLLQQQSPPPPLPPPPPAPSKAGPPILPDLNLSADEALDEENLQPLDQIEHLEQGDYYYRARAAEARKMRMVRVKERKLNLAPFRPPK